MEHILFYYMYIFNTTVKYKNYRSLLHHIFQEKRRTRKALEQKKLAETKLEAEQDK
jgi:hypothetical protein